MEAARRATDPTQMEWVPNREQRIVPGPMTALGNRCTGRQACLLWRWPARGTVETVAGPHVDRCCAL